MSSAHARPLRPVRAVGVVVKQPSADAATLIRYLLEYNAATARPRTAKAGKGHPHPPLKLFWEKTAAPLARKAGLPLETLVRRHKLDLLLVAGGDGSLLRVARRIYPARVPLLGINLGNLGFLTGLALEELPAALPQIAQGALHYSPRLLLRAVIHTRGRSPIRIPFAINEIAIVGGENARLVRLRAHVDGALVTEYRADGLLIATPTGSTAYNLAAGGPILSPEATALVLTPVAPHTLTNRALVVGADAKIKIEAPRQTGSLVIQADGQPVAQLKAGDWIEITRAPASVSLAYLKTSNFFQILRQKLRWSGASVES